MKLTNSLKKRFVKECSLPITVFHEPNFTESINLLDRTYNTKKLLADFMDLLKSLENEEFILKEFHRVNQKIQSYLNNDKYEEFIKKDFNTLNSYTRDTKRSFKFTKNLYVTQHENKKFISLDLVKANFTVFKMYNIINEKTWIELVSKFTPYQHFLNSKYLRQVVFGNLNPKRQHQVQEYLMCKLFNLLPESLKVNVVINADELIFEVNSNDITHIEEIIKTFENIHHVNIRVEIFELKVIRDKKDKPYFIKKGDKIMFKAVPGVFFNQVYREYFQIENNDLDLDFYYEGIIASFKERLF